jgi:predicted Zn-dependent protease
MSGAPPRSDRLEPGHAAAERALEGSSGAGRIAIVEDVYEAELRFANNTATTNGVRRSRRVSVVSFAEREGGVAAGAASRSGAGAVADIVAAAEADAASSPFADDAFELVAPGSPGAGSSAGDFEDPAPTTSLASLDGVLRELGDVFARAAGSDRVMAGYARHEISTTYLASSTGLRLRHVQPDGKVELAARSSDGTRSSWAGAGWARASDLDLGALEARVARGLEWAEHRVELPAGRYEAILPPTAVADLVIMIDAAAAGLEAEEGRSVFSARGGRTRVGERLSSLPFRLRSDPGEAGLECASWLATAASGPEQSVFDNGLAVGPTDWIEDGTLRRLRYHRAGAERSETVPTPPVGNLVLELPGAEASLDDLIAGTERGLLLTCLWYIREVDPATLLLTGLTRDGVYLVEAGEVVGAVNNFRFNESPVDLLGRVIEAGRTERALSREWGEWMTRTAMPPLRVDGFNMSTVSQAT